MNPFRKNQELQPGDWGLEVTTGGELSVGGIPCSMLARTYGTPLHVVNEPHLATTGRDFVSAFSGAYPGNVSVHFAFKCNPVPGVVEIVKSSGLKAEVMSEFELFLARRLGFQGEEIIANGPFKPDSFLSACLEKDVRFVIIDSIDEMERLDQLARRYRKEVGILLRVNPDFTPKGMNSGTATGSRKGCAFGLDLRGGEVNVAMELLPGLQNLKFRGFHFHIGTGIRRPGDYATAMDRLKAPIASARRLGLEVSVLDIGGGIAAPLSREMTTVEMLRYQAFDRLPIPPPRTCHDFREFAGAIARKMRDLFPPSLVPELIVEPGRSIASSSQLLLLGVHQVKNRPGAGRWITTDGGIGTVTMPAFYEYHEVFLCNDVHRPRKTIVTINGPGCFAADVVYRRKRMPEVGPGDTLAIMDSGAYFTSWESVFGFPRPAIVSVMNGQHRLLRSRETFDEMVVRDQMDVKNPFHTIPQ